MSGHEGATRLVLVRHGQTEWNASARIQGHTDIALDAHGRWQAARVAQALAEDGLHAIYSSDLSRAHDTARAIAQASAAPLHVELALRERGFGQFEGLTFSEIETRWPEHSARWRAREPDYEPLGGESLARFYARTVAVARTLAERHAGQHIALVAHGGVLDCLYRAATGLAIQAPRSWQLGNATINRLLYADGSFSLVGWDDASHLAA